MGLIYNHFSLSNCDESILQMLVLSKGNKLNVNVKKDSADTWCIITSNKCVASNQNSFGCCRCFSVLKSELNDIQMDFETNTGFYFYMSTFTFSFGCTSHGTR